MKDVYPDAGALPHPRNQPEHFATEIWLNLAETPPSWGDRLLQVDL